MARKPLVLGIDAGGTMTDTFVVDENGDFTVGKAATTPHDESLGFLESADGREIYFHRNSVLDDAFTQLAPGARVTFREEVGDKGPRASTVRLLGQHGLR